MPPILGEFIEKAAPMPGTARKTSDVIADNFGAIWPVHVAAFTRLLTQLRTWFDGDLDLLLVLAVIADRTREDRWADELLDYRDLIHGTGEDEPQSPINIQSVSDYTRIPRETVRRKVTTLVAKGWVMRREDGSLAVRKDAASALEGATRDTIAYLSTLHEAFEAVRRGPGNP